MQKMLDDFSLEHINAAVNAVGCEARYHKCDGPHHLLGDRSSCERRDVIEVFEGDDKLGHIVCWPHWKSKHPSLLKERKLIFTWKMHDYVIDNVWDIKRIIENGRNSNTTVD
jgi:hypothetical protein